MKLLYVAEGVPTRDPDRGDGSSMISYELIRHLPPDVQITLVTFGDGTEIPAEVAERCAAIPVFPLRSFHLMAARSVLFGGSVGALQRSGRASNRTVAALSRLADVTLLHGPHVTYLAGLIQGPLVLQVVDPWSARALMEAEVSSGWLRRYRARQAQQAAQAERALPAQARLLTVGRQDAQWWSSRIGRPVRNVANGVDTPADLVTRAPNQPPTVCFVGSLNYPPNVESAEILIREIAPAVWSEIPAARFVLAGRHPTSSVMALAGERVDVRGNVPSVLEIFQAADVAVFPDRQGLGIRNSVSEALAAGLPVVATPTAAREQPAHPLLRVVETIDELRVAVREVLAAPRPASALTTTSPEIRSWDTAAQDYLDELRTAMTDATSSPPAR